MFFISNVTFWYEFWFYSYVLVASIAFRREVSLGKLILRNEWTIHFFLFFFSSLISPKCCQSTIRILYILPFFQKPARFNTNHLHPDIRARTGDRPWVHPSHYHPGSSQGPPERRLDAGIPQQVRVLRATHNAGETWSRSRRTRLSLRRVGRKNGKRHSGKKW